VARLAVFSDGYGCDVARAEGADGRPDRGLLRGAFADDAGDRAVDDHIADSMAVGGAEGAFQAASKRPWREAAKLA
jgi:hypothetical protein